LAIEKALKSKKNFNEKMFWSTTHAGGKY